MELMIKRNSPLKLQRWEEGGESFIGYRCRGVRKSTTVPPTILKGEEDVLLEEKLDKVERMILPNVSVPLTQSMFDSLVSYIHSVGRSKWEGGRVRRELNKWNYVLAAEIIRADCRVFRGICKVTQVRREAEADMFLTSEDFIINTNKLPTTGRMANNSKFDRNTPKYKKRR